MTRRQREELERKLAQTRTLALEPNDRLTGERLVQLKSAIDRIRSGAFSCAVQNLSDADAAVGVPTCIGIPPEFNLFVERVVRHSRVVWRKVPGSALGSRPRRLARGIRDALHRL
jgi:hypothetical protein